MRLGCGGCLGTLLLLAALGGGALATTWVGSRLVAIPEATPLQGTEEDGYRAQQRIFEIVRRAASGRPRGQRAAQDHVLTEAELNAFTARHLGAIKGAPLEKLQVRLVGDGVVEVFGRVPLRRAFGDGWSFVVDYLPDSWRTIVFTVRLRGPLRLETETSPGQPKSLRLHVEEAYVGRQRVPVTAAEWMVGDEGLQLTRLRVPDSIESVTIEPRRAVVHTLS